MDIGKMLFAHLYISLFISFYFHMFSQSHRLQTVTLTLNVLNHARLGGGNVYIDLKATSSLKLTRRSVIPLCAAQSSPRHACPLNGSVSTQIFNCDAHRKNLACRDKDALKNTTQTDAAGEDIRCNG